MSLKLIESHYKNNYGGGEHAYHIDFGANSRTQDIMEGAIRGKTRMNA